jgi:hypothetical protein
VRDDDPEPPVEELLQINRRGRAGLGETDVNERAGMPEHVEALRHGLRPADDVEDEIELCARSAVCGAEALCRGELRLVEIDRVDLRRAGKPCALHD